MATDELVRRSPLGPLAGRLAETCAGPRFGCREDAFRVLAEVRCAPGHAEAAAALLGRTSLPDVGRCTVDGDRYVLGLGPGWWLVDDPDGSARPAGTAEVSAVDVSAQRTPLIMTGSEVGDVLAHGCTLDLHRRHFVEGAAAQTLLAKAGVMLARTAADEYRVWARASFARYLATWLIDASAEYR